MPFVPLSSCVPPDELVVESQALPTLAAPLQCRRMGQASGFLTGEVMGYGAGSSRPVQLHGGFPCSLGVYGGEAASPDLCGSTGTPSMGAGAWGYVWLFLLACPGCLQEASILMIDIGVLNCIFRP